MNIIKKYPVNQFGFLTSIEVEQNMINVTNIPSSDNLYIPGTGSIRFSGIAPATPQIFEVMKKWFSDDPKSETYKDEWMCLYCASPNPLPKTHCSQCGAPRNWLIG